MWRGLSLARVTVSPGMGRLDDRLSLVSQEKLHKAAWGTALKRAQGERILDDPKLLRK